MSCYIGETENKISARKYQHEYDIKTQKKKNGIGDHMRSKNHTVNWNNRIFLAVEKDWKLNEILPNIAVASSLLGKMLSNYARKKQNRPKHVCTQYSIQNKI